MGWLGLGAGRLEHSTLACRQLAVVMVRRDSSAPMAFLKYPSRMGRGMWSEGYQSPTLARRLGPTVIAGDCTRSRSDRPKRPTHLPYSLRARALDGAASALLWQNRRVEAHLLQLQPS